MAQELFKQTFAIDPLEKETLPYDEAKLATLSQEWGEGVMDGEFSLTELLGMLGKHRKDPEAAVRAMPGWLATKREGIASG